MNHLLIIDPQNDFCDLTTGIPEHQPSLPVPGADDDMQRLAIWLERHSDYIDAVTLTLDSHSRFDIAHPSFWYQVENGHTQVAKPFTPITATALRMGKFIPRKATYYDKALHYLDTLATNGRYTLMLWPVHCEVGTWGHSVHKSVQQAMGFWEEKKQKTITRIFKGLNPWTEHYSAIAAEVADPQDPHTLQNTHLLKTLATSDTLYIAGEASSHCVKATVEHIIEYFEKTGELTRGCIVLLKDCMSPVSGFEEEANAFLKYVQNKGVTVETSTLCL
jgi:nicotinamidase-related amidase